jgi:hypothetical protein
MSTCAGEREQSGVADEPVPRREVMSKEEV